MGPEANQLGSTGDRIFLTEVGPRDGFQSWPEPVSTEVKLTLIRSALAAGLDRVEATSMVRPDRVPQLADSAEVLAALAGEEMQRVRVLVPNLRGFERAVEAGATNVLVNVGVTDGFNRRNLNRSVAETMAEISEIGDLARQQKVRVDGSVSVSWGCPYDGWVSAYQTLELAERLVDAGVSELSFGDTIGVATPPGVRDLAGQAITRFPGTLVTMHFHDTRGLALANVEAALEVGVRSFEGSVGGIGGCPFAPRSTGNVCTEDMLGLLESEGFVTAASLDELCEAARRLSADLGRELPGRLHRAGPAPWLAGGRKREEDQDG